MSFQTPIFSDEAPKAIGPYSPAVCVGALVFFSGQLPVDPSTGKLVEDKIETQTRQSLTNISALLKAAGLTFENVVKTTVYLADIKDFAAMNAVYAEFMQEPYPARSAVQVAALPMGARVEIEVICSRGKINFENCGC